MHDDPDPTRRRALCVVGAGLLGPNFADAQVDHAAAVATALRSGGVVFAMRHARAPGTFDPPQFKLGDCSTQRNLDDEGRAQARRIGAWFEARNLKPLRVRSSPWCRCLDTGTLAFGAAQAWPALGSPRGNVEATNAAHLGQLRAALREVAARPGGFEVWVTHMFVLNDLAATNTASGEGLVLRGGAGAVEVVARLALS
jgi:hypothetical protein